MRIIVFSIIIFINIIFQSTFITSISIFSILPNPSLVLIVVYTILRKKKEGIFIAFFAGMLQDIIIGLHIGPYAILYMGIAYLVGETFKDYYLKNLFPALINTFIFTLLYLFIVYIFNFFLRGTVEFGYFLFNIMLPESLYNVIYASIIYYPLYFINKKIEEHENPRRIVFKNN
ncbi:MAG: rod shape-determining protein MreD [Lachnospirales bacterium]